nr:LAGLIDADG family homing endonuclease [Paenibacillus xylanexedens]
MYLIDGKSKVEIKKMYNIRDQKVIDRWFKEANLQPRENGSLYSFNKNYFDQINTEDKAYWIGFIWCDGYVCKRERSGRTSYEFKLDLAAEDEEHLYKLRNALDANYEIKKYIFKNSFLNNQAVRRLYICNKYFASQLHEDYGLEANRKNIDKLISKIPKELIRHFIRGVLDADGSLNSSIVKDHGKLRYKAQLDFTTYQEICMFINNHFFEAGLTNQLMKITTRHDDRDGECRRISFSGNEQVPRLITYLYYNSNTYLDRKMKKYIEIKLKVVEQKGDTKLAVETEKTEDRI